MGSIFVAAFLLASFLLFIFLVVVFKIIGKDAGILAGHPFVEDKGLIFGGRPKKNIVFRSVILFFASAVITGGGVFLGKGTQKVRTVANDVRDGTEVSGELINNNNYAA